MKTITKTYNIYNYEELTEEAKEKARQWYLDDETRADIFKENIIFDLQYYFKNSALNVCFSLCYCQGDGLNIEGELFLYDFLEVWSATEKEKRTIKKYIDNSFNCYTFKKNNRYGYSCKFIDRKYIDSVIEEFTENLKYISFKNIDIKLITKFFNDIIDYFENLDNYYEEEGYKYFYEPDEEEIIEVCNINEWYFDINGNFVEA